MCAAMHASVVILLLFREKPLHFLLIHCLQLKNKTIDSATMWSSRSFGHLLTSKTVSMSTCIFESDVFCIHCLQFALHIMIIIN